MNVFVKPSLIDGQPALVRDPDTRLPLKAEGEWKLRSDFWLRRLRDGDVIEVAPVESVKPAKASQGKKGGK